MAPTVRCPYCAGELTGAPTCPSCGQPLTGPLAVRVWEVDQNILALQAERTGLLEQLRAEAAEPRLLSPSALPPRPWSAPDPAPVPARQLSGQQVLLWAGALLVLTAAIVFLAVSWSAIGVTGQVLVMALLTVLAAAITLRVAHRGLQATAEALALLTVGLAVVDAGAAWQLNLAGLREVDVWWYRTLAAAVLTAFYTWLSTRNLTLYVWCWAAVAAAVVFGVSALDATDADTATAAGFALIGAAALAFASRAVPAAWRHYRVPLRLAAVGYLLWSWSLALPEVYDGRVLGTAGICSLVALVGSAGCAVLARVDLGLDAFVVHPLPATGAALATVVTVIGLAGHGESAGLVVLALLTACLSTFALWTPGSPRARRLGVLVLIAQLATAGGIVHLFALSDLWTSEPRWQPLTVALALLTASGTVVAVRHATVRTPAALYAGSAAMAAVGVATYPQGWTWMAGVLMAGAIVVAALAGWRRTHGEEMALAIVALGTSAAAVACGAAAGARPLAGVLAAGGLAALAYGVLPRRGYVAVLGVLGCSAATWTLLLDADVTTIEAYSLPLAALAGLVGVVRLRRQPGTPSWLSVGPALTAGLLPSALASVDDDGLVRPLLVLVAAALVLVAGVALRWQSPVVIGTVALLIVAVAQLAPYAVGLPRWLTFGTVGLA
ncbi:MAG: hypothetical protein ABWY56_13390, partial [Propionibacteriaceae bacterium]